MAELLKKYSRQVMLLCALSILAVLFLLLAPWLFRHPVPCIHRQITGISCPLCGMTHAFYEILRFRFIGAFLYNPAVPFVLLFAGSEIIYSIYPATQTAVVKKVALWSMLIALLIVYGLRLTGFLN
jgi:hypothetical protein